MPFDFKAFDAKCTSMSVEELQREWEHYTRLISGSATSTAVSGVAIPFTLGVSVIGVGLAAPAIHNARKKREIIERHLNRHGTTHQTRKRDVLTPMAISGTVGVVTLGVGSMGAGAITNAAAEHGISAVAANEIAVKATTHLAVDAVAMAGEEHHMKQKKLAEAHNAWMLQQALEGKPVNGVAMAVPVMGPYNPNIHGLQPQPHPNYAVTPPGDMKIGPQISSNSGPIGLDPVMMAPTAPPTPLPPYSPPSTVGTLGYFPAQQQAGYSEKPMFHDASTFSSVPSQSQHYPVQQEKPTLYDTPPLPTLQPLQQQQTGLTDKPVIQDGSMFTPIPPQPYAASWNVAGSIAPSCPPTPYQVHSERRESQVSLHNVVPQVQIPETPSIPEMSASPVIPKPSEQYQQPHQNVYPQPLVQPTPQPMYPSYPGTMIPNSQPQQNDDLNNAMHRLSIVSLPPPPPPPPAVMQIPSPQVTANSATAPAAGIFHPPTPFTPAVTPGPIPHASSLAPSFYQHQQNQQMTSYFQQPPPSPAISTISSLADPMSPLPMRHFASPPPVSPMQSYAQPQMQSTIFNPYPTPVQTPGSMSPPPMNSVAVNFDYSSKPHSIPNFPGPPGMSSVPQANSQFGPYGYPTPTATPGPKMDGGLYFPPPPTAPVGGRR